MILYLETSCLVKLYVVEEGSAEVKNLVENADIVATSLISYIEVRAALSRKLTEGGMNKLDYELVKQEFESDWNKYFILHVSSEIIKAGGDLAEKHGLRGFDALHLASALALKEGSAASVSFSSADAKLTKAAKSEHLNQQPW